MAIDEAPLARVRALLAGRADVAERRMMGGRCFMVCGHMCCGVSRDRLMVRVGRDGHAAALAEPHVGRLDLGGRHPIGYVLVEREGFRRDADLRRWLARALAVVAALPPRAPA